MNKELKLKSEVDESRNVRHASTKIGIAFENRFLLLYNLFYLEVLFIPMGTLHVISFQILFCLYLQR